MSFIHTHTHAHTHTHTHTRARMHTLIYIHTNAQSLGDQGPNYNIGATVVNDIPPVVPINPYTLTHNVR